MNKTPWNPSKKATARVKNPVPVPTECNCCHDKKSGCIETIENKEIYGRNYGDWPWVYRCKTCNAYVGMHPFTNIPLGTLANAPMRQARKACKAPFETLYKTGKMSRSEAYQRLADKLGIPKEECHFGWFDIKQCQKAAVAVQEILLDI